MAAKGVIGSDVEKMAMRQIKEIQRKIYEKGLLLDPIKFAAVTADEAAAAAAEAAAAGISAVDAGDPANLRRLAIDRAFDLYDQLKGVKADLKRLKENPDSSEEIIEALYLYKSGILKKQSIGRDTDISDAIEFYDKKKELKAELTGLKNGSYSKAIFEALHIHKGIKRLQKKLESLKAKYLADFEISYNDRAEFAPPPANGGRRYRSRTQKKNRRSKKSRKC